MSTLSHSNAPAFDLRRLASAALATDGSLAPAVARVALGGVMLPHALQKTLGLFGGYGFEGTMGFFTETMGLPWLVALSVITLELVASLALIVGAGSRLAAAGIAAIMAGAVATVHAPHGFFMNWYGAMEGEGFEYHLLAIGLAAVVAIAGGGRASVDAWLSHRAR